MPGQERFDAMITRTAKLLLLAGIALFYTLVVFNNLTDFNSNYQFVRHVLMMDSTFPGNHGMWRALPSPAFHMVFYISIILWEDGDHDSAVVGHGAAGRVRCVFPPRPSTLPSVCR